MTIPLLSYLASIHRANPDAEVSGRELQTILSLDAVCLRTQLVRLAGLGLVEWDPHLTNVWVKITELGLAAVEDAESRQRPQ